MNYKKIIYISAGVWATAITVIVVKTAIDTRFNLNVTEQIVRYLDQEKMDRRFADIINNYKEPPTKP